MNKKVFIIGDSFGDASWPIEHDYEFVWPQKLTETYDVVNLALVGTGPEQALLNVKKLFENFPKEELLESYFIFLHSDVNRLRLSCYNNEWEQVHAYAIADGSMKHQAHIFLKQAFKWYMDVDWEMQQYLKNFSTVSHLSQFFKRTLFWPLRKYMDGPDQILDVMCSGYSQNLTVCNESLYDISTRDCGEDIRRLMKDPRPNHLQELNHIVMYGELVNWIENNKPIDTSKFKFVASIKD